MVHAHTITFGHATYVSSCGEHARLVLTGRYRRDVLDLRHDDAWMVGEKRNNA